MNIHTIRFSLTQNAHGITRTISDSVIKKNPCGRVVSVLYSIMHIVHEVFALYNLKATCYLCAITFTTLIPIIHPDTTEL